MLVLRPRTGSITGSHRPVIGLSQGSGTAGRLPAQRSAARLLVRCDIRRDSLDGENENGQGLEAVVRAGNGRSVRRDCPAGLDTGGSGLFRRMEIVVGGDKHPIGATIGADDAVLSPFVDRNLP